MTKDSKIAYSTGHKTVIITILCLFTLSLLPIVGAPKKRNKKIAKDEKVYLVHADELRYDQFSATPDAQIVKGKVQFRHGGTRLWCDSAYFYQASNSMRAFGHVKMVQGDTLSLTCNRAFYDGMGQMVEARENVVLKHRGQVLRTDSLNYDRLYNYAYFFEGGTLTDKNDKLVADWGEYNTQSREAVFRYNVKMKNGSRLIETDTLYYNNHTSVAHVVGPSKIVDNKGSVIHTENATFNSRTNQSQLYHRSTITDKDKSVTGDSLYYNDKTGVSTGYGNVVYVDKKNKNMLECGHLVYNEKQGKGFATRRAVVKDYSRGDTLYVHADTLRMETFHINTDSIQRKIHAYKRVKVFKTDLQAVCDSMVIFSKDSCLTMYKDPVVWNENRQLIGELIKVYLADSTIRETQILGQALSVEQMKDSTMFNQLAANDMYTYFVDGNVRENLAVGAVRSIFFPLNDQDSTIIGLNYIETDTMRIFISPQKQLERIKTNKAKGTLYPLTQIPPDKLKLSNFAWLDQLRPQNKEDIFEWRGKTEEQKLKVLPVRQAPIQSLSTFDTQETKHESHNEQPK